MTTYTTEMLTTRRELRQARRLGLAPTTPRERRRRADELMSRGAATLAAVAIAWYAGDIEAARAELYGGHGTVAHASARERSL